MKNEINERFEHDVLGSVRVVATAAEATNAIVVSLQAYARNGREMQVKSAFELYLSSDAFGNVLEAASATLTLTGGTDGQVVARSAGNSLGNTTALCITEDDGDVDVTVTQTSGADVIYVNAVLPNGEIVNLGALTFAA